MYLVLLKLTFEHHENTYYLNYNFTLPYQTINVYVDIFYSLQICVKVLCSPHIEVNFFGKRFHSTQVRTGGDRTSQ